MKQYTVMPVLAGMTTEKLLGYLKRNNLSGSLVFFVKLSKICDLICYLDKNNVKHTITE